MLVLDSKVLLEITRENTATEKYGGFEVRVGDGQFEVGKVVSVGPKVEGNIKEGDTVYFYLNAGKELMIDGKKYRVVSSAEILVVL